MRPRDRVLTTHCGSLPRPPDLMAMLAAEEAGEKVEGAALARRIGLSIGDVVRRQAEARARRA